MSANVVWQRILSFFPELVKGASGAAPAIDWTQGNVQSMTLNAATVTPTFVNPPGGCQLTLVITQDGTGGRVVTWPGAVSWIGGTPPILLSGPGQTTLVNFYFDGATYFGSIATAGTPSQLVPWTDVAAGTTLAASLARPNLSCDSSGAQSTINLPTAAQMANADGSGFEIKLTGNMLSPVIVNAGAGTTVELLNAPGTFGASTWLPIQGQGAFFKYDKATTEWKAWGTFKSGAPGQQSYNPGWYATLANVAWDPQAGVDSNSGAPGSPIATMAEVARRCGSVDVTMPYAANVKITQLTAENANTDQVSMTWRVSGGAQSVLLGTLVVKTPDFVPGGALTPKNQGTGALLAIGGFPAGTAAGDYVHNVTLDSYANVDTGGATPKFSQPIPAAVITTIGNPAVAEDNGWTAAHHYVVFTRNLVNLKAWRVIGGDATAGGVIGGGWVQWVKIADTSGTQASEYPMVNDSGISVLSGCQVLTRCNLATLNGRASSGMLLGCDVTGQVSFFTAAGQLYGTIARGGVNLQEGGATLDGGNVLHGVVAINAATVFWGDNFADGTVTVQGGVCRISASTGGTAAMWGSAALTLFAMGCVERATGANFAGVLLLSGAIKFGTQATGSAYVGAGVMTDGINLTATNIDTGAAGGPGLFDPISGARFCNTQ